MCTRNPSQPRRPLPLALKPLVACSGERPFLHKKNLEEETSLWDNLLPRYLCPVSCPVSVGMALISPSPGIESPVPAGVRTLACTAAECISCEPPGKKMVAFGADEPSSSGPAKGLKGVGISDVKPGVCFLSFFFLSSVWKTQANHLTTIILTPY